MSTRLHDRRWPLLDTSDGSRIGLAGAFWLAFLAVTVGDVALTLYGLERGLAEGNPVVRAAIGTVGPVAGLVAPKAALVAVGLVAWRVLDDGVRLAVPLGLAVPTGAAVVVNVLTIAAL